jgi:hypothetical protein
MRRLAQSVAVLYQIPNLPNIVLRTNMVSIEEKLNGRCSNKKVLDF